MESTGQVTDRSQNLLNYKDIDKTTDEFIKYYVNDFLQYFPKDSLIDSNMAIKVARQLYQSKGTLASYQFLFKVLYNSDFEVFYTKDAVLRASDGLWYVSKSLKLATTNVNFLSIKNYSLFGETTKSVATVESSIRAGNKTEVFISNIERLFHSGEYVRVVDSNKQDVLFNGQPLRAKVVGQISQIKIDPKNRGLFYQHGDPVIVYGGLESANGHGATAVVDKTTSGSILNINVLNPGYGYYNSPNTLINITNAPGAQALVGSLDPAANGVATVSFIPLDSIAPKQNIRLDSLNYAFANVANANVATTLADAFSFVNLTLYPISSVLLINGGGGITVPPVVTANSRYFDDYGNFNDIRSLGILAPIQIKNGGLGYRANDIIVFTGGSGLGAHARVNTVASNGMIQTVKYTTDGLYGLGGMGYKPTALPRLTVNSANNLASNASLYVPGVLGDGAIFTTVTDKTGAISTINLIDNGEDYIGKPNVSLKIQDIVVSNVSITNLPRLGDVVYQGESISLATYTATVNNASLLQPDGNPALSLYNLRVFDYDSNPNPNLELKIDAKNINMPMAGFAYSTKYNNYGVKTYGDGRAKANASFLDGLVISQGQYLNTKGQPSSFDVLQSSKFNNYTYQITVEKEIAKYKDILLNLLHPSGMKLIGRYVLKSNAHFTSTGYTNFTELNKP
jgi:hypothetical protein